MQAMILAAGRGKRLRSLTDKTPKPLIPVGSIVPIVRHVRRLAQAGFAPLVINLCYLGEQIREALGDGRAFGTIIHYSPESTLLGAAGGIRWAMESGLLEDVFAVVNADIVCDYDYNRFHFAPPSGAHLVLVRTPPQKSAGDFSLADGKLCPPANDALTYAGMGVYRASLFADLQAGGAHKLLPVLNQAIANDCATGEYYGGVWHDIGTPDALAAARQDERLMSDA